MAARKQTRRKAGWPGIHEGTSNNALNLRVQDDLQGGAMPNFAEYPAPVTEGYAPVTNPEADALARAHDWYSPEKVAERNKFLASYRWNDGKSAWEPIAGKPRDVAAEPLDCGKTRAEIQKDCTAFLKTHRWDEASGTYVAIKK